MMIWDFIRDFFVQYIFGGYTSNGDSFSGVLGYDPQYGDTVWALDYQAVSSVDANGDKMSLGLGDWLSTTATIIVMCLIVFLLICLVRWIFRAVSSAMLLK